MAEGFTHQHIPAGCLLIDIDYESCTLTQIQPRQWYFFTRGSDDLSTPLILPDKLQHALLASPALIPFGLLWNHGWIQMAFAIHATSTGSHLLGRVRVYVLPHDVNRSTQSSRGELYRSMSSLLRQMEYSPECWQGAAVYTPQAQPHDNGPIIARSSNDYDGSLLALFNQVPSPDPHPEAASNSDLRWLMQCLLESQVPGLTTTLYPYQGRSAAKMLQREMEPGRVIDPRLRPALDQAGQAWYYDDVSGLVLREPRYYDEAQSGILAEEMGTGKTLICLALILSTKSEPSKPPEPLLAETHPRRGLGSLMDMAAAATNKHSVAWKQYFETCSAQLGYEFNNCIHALTRPENRALYKVRNALVEPRRSNRKVTVVPPKEVFLSHLTLIITPGNLVKQWQNEIKKHTTGLSVLVLVNQDTIPSVPELLFYDVILFSESRFERIQKERSNGEGCSRDIYCPLEYIRFKRCIIDEGHKLGNGSRSWKNDVMRVIERLEISARWVVTGTPSRGLYSVHSHEIIEGNDLSKCGPLQDSGRVALKQEQEDLQRIGNLTAKYLKVRPWANIKNEVGDSVADWGVYVKRYNRKDCLINTLNSLLVRHQLTDVSTLLPPVDDKIIVLDGSFQDQLSLNLFSMMIIFNSVQSQRTDMDYFFHDRQKRSLVQLVKNLRQASFFGGVFFSAEDITKAVETAEGFLEKKAIPISPEDEDLLKQAIEFGKKAATNSLKNVSNRFHSMPIYLQDFPGGRGKSWSLDNEETREGLVCTDAGLVHSLQKFLNPCLDAPTSLQFLINSGKLDQQGLAERSQALATASDTDNKTTSEATALAGNTLLGGDYHTTPKAKGLASSAPGNALEHLQTGAEPQDDVEIAEPLAKTRIISTVSAKLSYLVDSIIKYQDKEQILIFYDNDNVAFYLAGVLEILQIQHLIYSRAGLSAERRAQYVTTFTDSPTFRVLLMDISQAAFGLDMRSASRIYFISPVLNPQVVAQAIGRARRISQQKPVSVETLVLRNSIEEVMIDRREHMTQAEHSRIKSVLDDGKIKEWIRNPKIYPMANAEEGLEQTARLSSPQFVFGKGFKRALDPDEGLITGSPGGNKTEVHDNVHVPTKLNRELKRKWSQDLTQATNNTILNGVAVPERPIKRRARVAWVDQEV
ncbi:SNF2 family N-terminal domain-containing protein [Xylaria cubensis]|nr:SNF2 family N-terminal domain-containing protein [Xylaria cubensis]